MAPGCPTVLIGGLPAARATDTAVCVGPPDMILKGSLGVFIGGLPAARMGDPTSHGGIITVGFPTVLIGDIAGGGGAGGASPFDATLASGAAMSAPLTQARTLVAAAKNGTPFCERCTSGS